MLDRQTQSCNSQTLPDEKKSSLIDFRCHFLRNFQSKFQSKFQKQFFGCQKNGSTPLVITTNNVATFALQISLKPLVVQGFRYQDYLPRIPKVFIKVFERFELQNIARKILEFTPHPRGTESRWRVTFCLRQIACSRPLQSDLPRDIFWLRKLMARRFPHVDVMLSEKFGKARYGNLMVCGSVWTCPCCAAKISTRRSAEINAAGDLHIASGGALYMMTYTFRHSRQNSLSELLGTRESRRGLLSAIHRFRNSRAHKELCASYGVVGYIRSLEVTKSYANGWHPHFHELLFFTRALSEAELRDFKNKEFELWQQACCQSSLPLPNRKNGVHIVRAYSPGEYFQKIGREQKWGAGAELTSAHVKKSRGRKGMTPFDLLRAAGEKQDYTGHEARSFIEYAKAFFGAKQCVWSAGLKKAFGIAELNDKEIADREDDQAQLVIAINRDMWRKVLGLSYEARGMILRLAETGGRKAIEEFLADL